MDTRIRRPNDAGIAMVTTLLVMMLVSALLIGFTAVVMSDQRYRFIDRDRSQAFYGAAAGLEKLTADLGNLFFANVAPTSTQIQALTTSPPSITGVSYQKADGSSGYTVTTQNLGSVPISAGPYQGLNGLVTKYTMDVTARTATTGEVHLQRVTETVAIPVFQFGIFSEVDMSFSAADNFDFGGRVHTNGNLFLAEGASGTLIMRDKVTAVREIVRQRLSNGNSIDNSSSTGPVKIATASGGCNVTTSASCKALPRTDGSVTDGLSPLTQNEPRWHTVSLSDYNGNLKNGRTGAKTLSLPLITIGGTNTDLVRRPTPTENSASTLFGERFFGRASVRILLSDTITDITGLPTVTNTSPILLDGDWRAAPPAGYGPVNATHPPVATSPGSNSSTLSASVTSGATSISVTNNSASQWFRPGLTVNGTAVICSAKTASQFSGCTGTPAAPSGAPVTSGLASTTLNGALTAGSTTINVATNGTTNFVPKPFWIGNSLVTCTGYTATTFTGCAGTPAASSGAAFSSGALSSAGTGLIGGYLKVEVKTGTSTWQDVTLEILNWGIGAPNLSGQICADPTPNAILRVQRLRDNQQSGANGGGCNYAGSTMSTDYWPNTLFDTREAIFRDTSPGGTNLILGGVMHYVTLDVKNLSKWLAGTAPYNGGSGPTAISNNGYTVYVSDRRNNRDSTNQETGEYGFEDFVNSTTAGVPDGQLETGEDLNGSSALDTYGQFPSYNGSASAVPPGASAPLDLTARPTTQISRPQAQVNRAVLFRRALKLTNGAIVGGVRQIVSPGLTIATENPLYLQGDWNASTGGFDSATDVAQHVATSVIADAVTMLSNNWNDNNSFSSPYAVGGRPRAANTYFRVAVLAGKGQIFPQPTGSGATFGTDGGAHSFLRFLEGDGSSPDKIWYRGSLATFYYSRQAVGPFKCCGGLVYSVPARGYAFDIDFLNPARLPPETPMFRDLNTIGFSQETRPGR